MVKRKKRDNPPGNCSDAGGNSKAFTETQSTRKNKKAAAVGSSELLTYLSSLNVDQLVEELNAYQRGQHSIINSSPSNNCNQNSTRSKASLLPKQTIETLALRTAGTASEGKPMQVKRRKSSTIADQQPYENRKNTRNGDFKYLDKHPSKIVKHIGKDASVSSMSETASKRATVTEHQASLLDNYLSVKTAHPPSVDKKNNHAHLNTNGCSLSPTGHSKFSGNGNKKYCHANNSVRNIELKNAGAYPNNLSVIPIEASATVKKKAASPLNQLNDNRFELCKEGNLLRPIHSCLVPASIHHRKKKKKVRFSNDLEHCERECPITAIKPTSECSDDASLANTEPQSDFAKIISVISTVPVKTNSSRSDLDAANLLSLPPSLGYVNGYVHTNSEGISQYCDSSNNLSLPSTSKPTGVAATLRVKSGRCRAPVQRVLEAPPSSPKEDSTKTDCSEENVEQAIDNERADTTLRRSSRLESSRINDRSRADAPGDNSTFFSANFNFESNQNSTSFLHGDIQSVKVDSLRTDALLVEHAFVSDDNSGTDEKKTTSSTEEQRSCMPCSSAHAGARCHFPGSTVEKGGSVGEHGRHAVKRKLHFSDDVAYKKGFNEGTKHDGSKGSSDLELLDGVVPCGVQVYSAQDTTSICSAAGARPSQLKTCTNIFPSIINVQASSMSRFLVSGSVGDMTKVCPYFKTNSSVSTFLSLQKASGIDILCNKPENAPSSSGARSITLAPTLDPASLILNTSSTKSYAAPCVHVSADSPSKSLSTGSNCSPGIPTSSHVFSCSRSSRAESVVTSSPSTTSTAFSPTTTLIPPRSIGTSSIALVPNSADSLSSSKPADTGQSQAKYWMPRGPHVFHKYCLCSLPLMCQGIETGPFPSLTRKIGVGDSRACSSTVKELALLPRNVSDQKSVPTKVEQTKEQYEETLTNDSIWSNACNASSVRKPEEVEHCQNLSKETQTVFSRHTRASQHAPVATLTCNTSVEEYQTSIPESSCYESDSSFAVDTETITEETVVRQCSNLISPSNSKGSCFSAACTDVSLEVIEARNIANACRVADSPEKFLVSAVKRNDQSNKTHAPSVGAIYLQNSGSMGPATRDIFQYHMTGHQQNRVQGGSDCPAVELSLSPSSPDVHSFGLNKCDGDRGPGDDSFNDGASLGTEGDCPQPVEERETATVRKRLISNERETCNASSVNLVVVHAGMPASVEQCVRNKSCLDNDPFKKPLLVTTNERKCRQEHFSFTNEETDAFNNNQQQKNVTDTLRKLRHTSVESNSQCCLTTQGTVTGSRLPSACHTVRSSPETGVDTQELFRTQRTPLPPPSPPSVDCERGHHVPDSLCDLLGSPSRDEFPDPYSNGTLKSAATIETVSFVTKSDGMPHERCPDSSAGGSSFDKNPDADKVYTQSKEALFPPKFLAPAAPVASGLKNFKRPTIFSDVSSGDNQNSNSTQEFTCVDTTVGSAILSSSNKQATPPKTKNTVDLMNGLTEIDWSEMSDSYLYDPVLATPPNRSPKVRCTPSKSASNARTQTRSPLFVASSRSLESVRFGRCMKKNKDSLSSASRARRADSNCSCQSCSQYQHDASSFLSRVFREVLQSCRRPSSVATSSLTNGAPLSCIDSRSAEEGQTSYGLREGSGRQRSRSKCRRRLAFVDSDSSSSCDYNPFRKKIDTDRGTTGRDGTPSVQKVAISSVDPSRGHLTAGHKERVTRRKNLTSSLCCVPRGKPMGQINTSDERNSSDDLFFNPQRRV